MLDRAKFSVGSIYFLCKKKIVDPTMDPTGIFFLYVIASPQAECQARVNVNATHGTKTRVADVSLHLTLSSRSIYPAGITIGIFSTDTYLGTSYVLEYLNLDLTSK